jgi:hypothetical protein
LYTCFNNRLLQLGLLARDKEAKDTDIIGEVVFHPGQLERNINYNEMDSLLDETTGKRGGRPSAIFYSNEVTRGSNAANKMSNSATIIFESTLLENLASVFPAEDNCSNCRRSVNVNPLVQTRSQYPCQVWS